MPRLGRLKEVAPRIRHHQSRSARQGGLSTIRICYRPIGKAGLERNV